MKFVIVVNKEDKSKVSQSFKLVASYFKNFNSLYHLHRVIKSKLIGTFSSKNGILVLRKRRTTTFAHLLVLMDCNE